MQYIAQAGSVAFIVFVVAGMLWTFNRFWKRHMIQPPTLDVSDDDDDELVDDASVVEIEAMVDYIQNQIQSDPYVVSEAVTRWIREDDEFSI